MSDCIIPWEIKLKVMVLLLADLLLSLESWSKGLLYNSKKS